MNTSASVSMQPVRALANTGTAPSTEKVVPFSNAHRQSTATSTTPQTVDAAEHDSEELVAQIREQIEQLSQQNQNMKRQLNFDIDDSTGQTVITVRNAETDEVIRKIPSDELLALSRRISELQKQGKSSGLFVSEDA